MLTTHPQIPVVVASSTGRMGADDEERNSLGFLDDGIDDNYSSSHRSLFQADIDSPPLITIWNCPYMNTVSCEDLEQEGKYIFGWTCRHCPQPLCSSQDNFFKTKNATKALHHVLKTPSQCIRPFKGSICCNRQSHDQRKAKNND